MRLHHVLYAMIVAFIWGVHFAVCKVALKDIPSFTFAAIRYFLTCAPFIFFFKRPPISWLLLISIGLSYGFISFCLLIYGINLGVPTGLMSLLFQIQSVFSVLLSLLFLKVVPSVRQVVGLTIAMIGIGLVSYTTVFSNHHHLAPVSLVGIFVVIAAGFFWAVGNVLIKKAGPVNSVSLTVWTFMFACFANSLMAFWLEYPLDRALHELLTPTSLTAVVYSAILAALCASSLQSYLLRVYSPTQVAPFSLLVPIFGLGAGWIILGEQISFQTGLSSCIVLLGLIINQFAIFGWTSRPLFVRTK